MFYVESYFHYIGHIDYSRYHTKAPCVTYFGQIQMIAEVGVFLPVERDTLLGATSPKCSIIATA